MANDKDICKNSLGVRGKVSKGGEVRENATLTNNDATAMADHRISSLKTRRRITFFREDSIKIHPMVKWRKGEISYEEASTYFLNGGTYFGCRSATLEEKIYSIKNLLTEPLLQCVDAVEGACARQATLLMIDGGPGEGMPDPLPIPLEKVELELRII